MKSSALECGHFPALSALGFTYLVSLGEGSRLSLLSFWAVLLFP